MNKWIICGIAMLLVFGGVYYLRDYQIQKREQQIAEIARLEKEAKIKKELEIQQAAFNQIKAKADSAKTFCLEKGFTTEFCYLLDLKIHSGKNRFFVWDFARDTISDAGICCHGKGKGSTAARPVFSNDHGSLCSSLGKYQVANRDHCGWGTLFQYRLVGLEDTNNNAFKRHVTLHSYQGLPEEEPYPKHIPLGYSEGCAIVTDSMLRRLDVKQKSVDKPVLLWIYY